MLTETELTLLAVAGLSYMGASARLRARGRPPSARRFACFFAGLTTVAVAVLAFEHSAQHQLYPHTIEHLLIGDVGALLIALGLARPLPPVPRGAAVALWIVNMLLWHWPAVFEAALGSWPLHLLAHVLLLVLGVGLWIALLRPGSWMQRIGVIASTRALGAALGAAAIWLPSVAYPVYVSGDVARATSPLADQSIAGAILLAEMAAMAIGALLWLRSALAREPVAVEAERLDAGSAAV